jgi:hypothetical protein
MIVVMEDLISSAILKVEEFARRVMGVWFLVGLLK